LLVGGEQLAGGQELGVALGGFLLAAGAFGLLGVEGLLPSLLVPGEGPALFEGGAALPLRLGGGLPRPRHHALAFLVVVAAGLLGLGLALGGECFRGGGLAAVALEEAAAQGTQALTQFGGPFQVGPGVAAGLLQGGALPGDGGAGLLLLAGE